MSGPSHLPFPSAPPRCLPPWQSHQQLRQHLARLLDDVELLTALADELRALNSIKEASLSTSQDKEEASSHELSLSCSLSSYSCSHALHEALEGKNFQELDGVQRLALESATALQQSICSQVAPLLAVLQEKSTWEEAAALARLSSKRSKVLRNRKRRKKRRQLAAEALQKEKEAFDQVDTEADEWRAREIAKDIAKRKIEKMKEVAKRNAKEERQRLERELELVLIVEKLQELRALRIQRLKKQGSFFPEEDNRFMERVRAAVEEEERKAAAAADTSATAAAIATAEEARKAGVSHAEAPKLDFQMGQEFSSAKEDTGLFIDNEGPKDTDKEKIKTGALGFPTGNGNLPAEFYHYYYGSNVDMGTLIEVRRLWDSFILPGGSRIPGHWVQPPPPADNVWASCLVTNSQQAR